MEVSGNERWYSLLPMKQEKVKDPDLGSLRVKASMIEEKIMPLKEYNELLDVCS